MFRRLGNIWRALNSRRAQSRICKIGTTIGINRIEAYALSVELTKPTVKDTRNREI